ncbi:uncharacterized protein LOC128267952 [Anopheles cruzii]|uniref:uncharacterized protein LOC128267952 n=1 Tax=Anopheles cruzii TaxID=68878 RepID=UPI0022EC317B|nr:uncharacterized protein LOC128267952 [Anopheles cruzii]
MKSHVAILVSILFGFFYVEATATLHNNSFDAIRGCRQYENVQSYEGPVQYLPVSSLRNVGTTSNSVYFKVGIVGPNDGIIRYGPSQYPFERDVIEIVISGWANTKSVGRRQRRNTSNQANTVQLAEVLTRGLMSQFRPTMIKVEVFANGLVRVSKDNEKEAFLQFGDDHHVAPLFLGFTKWDRDLIVFYDCPL